MTFRQGEAQSSLSRRPRATHLHLAGGPIARSSPSRCAHGGRRPPASPAGRKKAPSFSPPCLPHRPTPPCPAPAAHRRLVEDDISAAAEGEQPPAPPGDGPAARPVGAAGDMAEGDGRRHLAPPATCAAARSSHSNDPAPPGGRHVVMAPSALPRPLPSAGHRLKIKAIAGSRSPYYAFH